MTEAMRREALRKILPERPELEVSGFCPRTLKDIVSTVQGVFAIAALCAALVWFVARTEWVERVNVEHVIEHRKLSDKWTWIRVETHIENVGNVPVEIGNVFGSVRRVLPLEPAFAVALEKGHQIMEPGKRLVAWRRLGEPHKFKLGIEVQPQETEVVDFEYVVPSTLKTVQVITRFQALGREGSFSKLTTYELK